MAIGTIGGEGEGEGEGERGGREDRGRREYDLTEPMYVIKTPQKAYFNTRTYIHNGEIQGKREKVWG